MWQNSTWWSEAHLNFGRVGHHSWVVAPSYIKCEKRTLQPNGLFSSLFLGHAAGKEAIKVGGGGDKGEGRTQRGSNSRIKWGGTEICR